jgi:serine/threonine protein kinase
MTAPTAPIAGNQKADAILDDLLAEFANKLQAGECVDVDAYTRKYPDHADALQQLLPAMQLLVAFEGCVPGADAEQAAAPTAAEMVLGELGDFRIIREVGRGGMGVVFEAEQRSLRRRVALKVLPFAAALDARQLQRFHNEAQAAALLHHQNIVPVYGVGCERGVHYYAMQFIEGRTLAALIHDRRQLYGIAAPPDGAESRAEAAATSTPRVAARSTERSGQDTAYFRLAAQLGVHGAEALEHAHQMGVIHRDVKPANLLVDVRGNLWITDFGLAHVLCDTKLTLTGDLVGTLRYMSPEQALARRAPVDQRTDIYSLGATLYELLTLEPAMTAQDRQELLRQIAFEEPVALRRHNAAIPRELETIVLKAMAKQPGERYATAQELADDLQRFLDDRPIQARRPTLLLRTRKWMYRHRTVVRVVEAACAVLLVGLAIGAVLLWRAKHETEQALASADSGWKQVEIERDLAIGEQQRAQANAELSWQAADDMYTRVADQWLAYQPQLEHVQRDFLLKALQFYQEYARLNGDRPAVRARTVIAYQRVGRIQYKLNQYAEARAADEQAIAECKKLEGHVADEAQRQLTLADLYNNLHLVHRDAGSLDAAQEANGDAIRILEVLAEQFPLPERNREAMDKPGGLVPLTLMASALPPPHCYHFALAQSRNNLGSLLRNGGHWSEAEQIFAQALATWTLLAPAFPGVAEVARDKAIGHANLALVLHEMNRVQDAEQHLRAATELQQRLVDGLPQVPLFWDDFALTLQGQAHVFAETGRAGDAETADKRLMAIREKLTADFPKVPGYRRRLGLALHNYGTLLSNLGRLQDAETPLRRGLALQQTLVDEFATVRDYRFDLAASHNALGLIQRDTGRAREAEEGHSRAVKLLEKLYEEGPTVPAYASALGGSLSNLATMRLRAGQPGQGVPLLERAIVLQRKALAAHLSSVTYRRHLGYHYELLALCYRSMGKHTEAERACQDAIVIRDKLAADMAGAPGYRAALGDVYTTMGFVLAETKRLAQAEKPFRRALELRQALAEEFPREPARRSQHGAALHNLAWSLGARGEWDEAIALYRRAIDAQRAALDAAPRHPTYRKFVARHYHDLEKTLLDLGKHAEAAEVATALPALLPSGGSEHVYAASVFLRCIKLARDDPAISEPDLAPLTKAYADKAMEMLRRAVANGYASASELKTAPWLDSLRQRADFQKLIAEVEKKSSP